MIFDITERVQELHKYYDKLLDERILKISELAKTPIEQFRKINPLDFIEKNPYQYIKGYNYSEISSFIRKTKRDDVFLISPLDAIEETAEQVGYKTNQIVTRTIRASKCEVLPVPKELAMDFFIRNHRQSAPAYSNQSICFGLVYGGELVAVMLYDISAGGVRGNNYKYELVRLSISKHTRIHGGASKLQKACEHTLQEIGETKIYSYSNATINNGVVYQKLGFIEQQKDLRRQTMVIMKDNSIQRLLSLEDGQRTNEQLALRGLIKTHLGGNKTWEKDI